MNNKNKHISIRIEDKTLQKFHYVSKYEDRSASGQMYLINNCIQSLKESNVFHTSCVNQ